MVEIRNRYGWEVEHAGVTGGAVLRQYNEDGSENPSTMIQPEDVVRASIVPRVPVLPRHDVLIDWKNGEKFVKRFGSSFIKKTETNLDAILASYRYRLVGGLVERVDYSIGGEGVVTYPDGIDGKSVKPVSRLSPIWHALAAMRLTSESRFQDLLLCLKCFDRTKPVEERPVFYKGLINKYGAEGNISEILLRETLSESSPLGVLLNQLGFPRGGTKTEYLQCLQTNRYRLWVFSTSGRTLVTHPDFQVNL